jgi:hypothetical protein
LRRRFRGLAARDFDLSSVSEELAAFLLYVNDKTGLLRKTETELAEVLNRLGGNSQLSVAVCFGCLFKHKALSWNSEVRYSKILA